MFLRSLVPVAAIILGPALITSCGALKLKKDSASSPDSLPITQENLAGYWLSISREVKIDGVVYGENRTDVFIMAFAGNEIEISSNYCVKQSTQSTSTYSIEGNTVKVAEHECKNFEDEDVLLLEIISLTGSEMLVHHSVSTFGKSVVGESRLKRLGQNELREVMKSELAFDFGPMLRDHAGIQVRDDDQSCLDFRGFDGYDEDATIAAGLIETRCKGGRFGTRRTEDNSVFVNKYSLHAWSHDKKTFLTISFTPDQRNFYAEAREGVDYSQQTSAFMEINGEDQSVFINRLVVAKAAKHKGEMMEVEFSLSYSKFLAAGAERKRLDGRLSVIMLNSEDNTTDL